MSSHHRHGGARMCHGKRLPTGHPTARMVFGHRRYHSSWFRSSCSWCGGHCRFNHRRCHGCCRSRRCRGNSCASRVDRDRRITDDRQRGPSGHTTTRNGRILYDVGCSSGLGGVIRFGLGLRNRALPTGLSDRRWLHERTWRNSRDRGAGTGHGQRLPTSHPAASNRGILQRSIGSGLLRDHYGDGLDVLLRWLSNRLWRGDTAVGKGNG